MPDNPAVIPHKSVNVGASYNMNYIEIYQLDVLNLPAEITYARNRDSRLAPAQLDSATAGCPAPNTDRFARPALMERRTAQGRDRVGRAGRIPALRPPRLFLAIVCAAGREHRRPQFTFPAVEPAKVTVCGNDADGIVRDRALPGGPLEVARLYDTSAKLVRYLFNKYPPELFPKFAAQVIDGRPPAEALREIYGREFSDLPELEKRFRRWTR